MICRSRLRPVVTLCALVTGTLPAFGQDTIAVYGDTGEGIARTLTTPTGWELFDLVVVVNADEGVRALEFKITELTASYPGVIKLPPEIPGDSPRTNSQIDLGHYVIAFDYFGGTCLEPGAIEVLRLSYMDLDGVIGRNFVITPGPLQPGDETPPSCSGTMCSFGCPWVEYALAGAPWEDVDVIDPLWIPGVESSDGVLVLNPDPMAVSGEPSSLGCLKARF